MEAALVAQQSILQQNIAMSVIKQANDMQKAMADILMQSAANVPVSASRGTSVNLSA